MVTLNGPTLTRTGRVYSLQMENHGLSTPEPGMSRCSQHCIMALQGPGWVLVHMDTIHPALFSLGTTTEFFPNKVSDAPGIGFPVSHLETL